MRIWLVLESVLRPALEVVSRREQSSPLLARPVRPNDMPIGLDTQNQETSALEQSHIVHPCAADAAEWMLRCELRADAVPPSGLAVLVSRVTFLHLFPACEPTRRCAVAPRAQAKRVAAI